VVRHGDRGKKKKFIDRSSPKKTESMNEKEMRRTPGEAERSQWRPRSHLLPDPSTPPATPTQKRRRRPKSSLLSFEGRLGMALPGAVVVRTWGTSTEGPHSQQPKKNQPPQSIGSWSNLRRRSKGLVVVADGAVLEKLVP